MPSSTDPLIVFENVKKSFGTQHILRGVDFTINRGETMVIIGGSGTGKSVTLKLIMGLLHPDVGRVTFDGSQWKDLDPKVADKQRTRFGYVFQGGALFDSININENVSFPLREHRKKSEAEMLEIVNQCLLDVGLTDVGHKMPNELSGGMQKRVSLARALAMNPEILLYDEPTTGLDPINSQKINELISKTRQKHNVTSIVVTHDMHSAFFLADKIIMIFKGELIFQGSVDELKNSDIEEVRCFIEPALSGSGSA